MKGVVFNLLESFISEGWGDAKYEQILGLCPLKTKEPFVGPGTYPDSDLMTIAGKTAELLGLPLHDAVRAFGRYCFPKLIAKVPDLVGEYSDAKSFLKGVDGVIHVEVRKLFPKAITPSFKYEENDVNHLRIYYQSERKLCAFMEGLLDGVSDHFKIQINQEHKTCMHHGAEHCAFDLTFLNKIEEAA
jgi:predicted hydrocarbon binding protein